MQKVWFITGSSRGLGRNITEAVLANGDIVVATARNIVALNDLTIKYPNQVLALNLDVADKSQIKSAVETTIDKFGRIDVLVNNAGFGITGAAEAFTEDQVESQLMVNLIAPIAITRAVLPYMRKQRNGFIMQISSVGGRIGNAGLSLYSAAKFGLTGFSECLQKEVGDLGIKVTSIEPGGFRTDWAGSSMSFAPVVEGYENSVEATKAFLTSGKYVPLGDPEKAAKVIVDLADHPTPPMHLILGSEGAAIIQKTNEARTLEYEKWLDVTKSTDVIGEINFLETEEGKLFLKQKGLEM
ncbi:SDR family NAD(P)-dependent oxidoreductase [Rhizosphaericola mali]|uniref:SDR family NAD(P)-dependent oxidoreductase n=1 Tax=Rhizosphaericola mali TaxID=2545455 RepID=A0A5P2FY04_9BACT|nr:SDR family NAD(P)-dependent oxidoreductase [Rhizosphaericola mali]QES88424.1 SDR family NAD(P)-dependent oxidoreductase [Rhizosphaericola mali]